MFAPKGGALDLFTTLYFEECSYYSYRCSNYVSWAESSSDFRAILIMFHHINNITHYIESYLPFSTQAKGGTMKKHKYC